MTFSDAFKQFIEEHENDDIHDLILHAARYPDIDIPQAAQQIAGRQIAKLKMPEWYRNKDILYPGHISLEQSSSEYTARYKAGLTEGKSFADITGGMGIDFYFISKKFKQTVYVEQQAELAYIANHNFNNLGIKDYEIRNEDGIEYLKSMSPVDVLYIDPARRSNTGKKVFRIEDCTPDIIELENLLEQKSKRTMIKLSPMLDISLALKSLRNISDIHIISHRNEVKELVFIKDNINKATETRLHCVNIKKDKTDIFSFTKEEEQACISHVSQLGKYLYEPNASIMKAGAYKSITHIFPVNKLHVNSHLYTSDTLITDFQGRSFIIENVCSFNKNEIRQCLSGIKQANISTRNFPLNPQELKKKLKINDGGNLYIFATTLADERKVLIVCKKIE